MSLGYDEIDKLPEAVLYDTNLELDFIEAANKSQKKFQVSEVIITSDRWASTFNESGHVIARFRNASILANNKGICYLQHIVFEQKGNGEIFKEITIIKKSNWNIFNCNLLEKKNPDTIARVQYDN
ncbi:hypothetical protein [uncultured Croceitalea sp.]|uniref:hypothetical protein n=1 Tax=uncultured Croceitalea sp. TaxID=1798908 RepID=UPI0033064DC7